MNKRGGHRRGRAAGFSLIELLVVIVIMGLVVSAIMSLYVNMQKTSGSDEEVVEIQQGLRIALDRIAQDLRMAGFLMTDNTIGVAGPNSITLVSAASSGSYARIGAEAAISSGSATLAIDPPGMAQMFDTNDSVRIVSPVSGKSCVVADPSSSASPVLTVTSAGAGTISVTEEVSGSVTASNVLKECMVVRAAGASSQVQITYELDADPVNPAALALVRRVNGAATTTENAQLGKISKLEFFYILDSGAVLTTVPTASLESIRSVRVKLEASTVDTVALTGTVKTREAETTVKLYNR
jgi:prepilin-type N-terminal cleavage/methylation domain-containing protein